MIASSQIDRAMNGLHGDIWYARMLAVRAAERVEVRFSPNVVDACITRYDVVVLSAPERQAKRIDVATKVPGVCLSHNNANALRFNSRGVPYGVVARTFTSKKAGIARTMALSQAGRLHRAP
jgi:Tfp pilus assembly protein FimT